VRPEKATGVLPLAPALDHHYGTHLECACGQTWWAQREKPIQCPLYAYQRLKKLQQAHTGAVRAQETPG
jgi:hypothetical protein